MTGGGIERVLRGVSAALPSRQSQPLPVGLFASCEVLPLSGPCACLHHWRTATRRRTNRQTHRCSEQVGLSALWCGTGAVTGGD